MKLTWEEAVAWARNTPAMAPLVEVCYYDDPIEAAATRFRASEEWQAIIALLEPQPGATVLEIGAGRGLISWCFAVSGCKVHAIEPDPSLLVGAGAIRGLCAATGQLIDVIGGSGERLDFESCTFDKVICRAVLHHVTDLDLLCREVFRVLKPGGQFLAIKEHVAESDAELDAFLRSHPLHHLYGGEHAYPLKKYKRALLTAGFPGVRNFGQFDHPVSSYPPYSKDAIRKIAQEGFARWLGPSLSSRIARNDRVIRFYRRWLTFRCRTPGRTHSFLVEKPL